jgi:hypothetical protein
MMMRYWVVVAVLCVFILVVLEKLCCNVESQSANPRVVLSASEDLAGEIEWGLVVIVRSAGLVAIAQAEAAVVEDRKNRNECLQRGLFVSECPAIVSPTKRYDDVMDFWRNVDVSLGCVGALRGVPLRCVEFRGCLGEIGDALSQVAEMGSARPARAWSEAVAHVDASGVCPR